MASALKSDWARRPKSKIRSCSRARGTSKGVSGQWPSPPPVAIDSSLAWVLHAAFASAFDGAIASKPRTVLRLARGFEVSGRIADRLQGGAREPLTDLVRELDADYFTNLAVEALLGEALGQVADIAARRSIPTIALKYSALKLGRFVRPGTRVVGDLDVLVPGAAARELSQALLQAGFSRSGTRSHAHQLEALVSAHGAVVELHTHIPGVHVVADRASTADDLLDADLTLPVLGSYLLQPRPSLLAAHALAHGLQQNRSTPQSYSLLRMLGDLLDLRRLAPNAPLLESERYVSLPLRALCSTADRLCGSLEDGLFDGLDFDGTPQQTLLWHCLAAGLDSRYMAQLRASGFADKLRSGANARELLRYVSGALFPPQHELDAIYGPAQSKVVRLRRRLQRPFEVTLRAARHWTRWRER